MTMSTPRDLEYINAFKPKETGECVYFMLDEKEVVPDKPNEISQLPKHVLTPHDALHQTLYDTMYQTHYQSLFNTQYQTAHKTLYNTLFQTAYQKLQSTLQKTPTINVRFHLQ